MSVGLSRGFFRCKDPRTITVRRRCKLDGAANESLRNNTRPVRRTGSLSARRQTAQSPSSHHDKLRPLGREFVPSPPQNGCDSSVNPPESIVFGQKKSVRGVVSRMPGGTSRSKPTPCLRIYMRKLVPRNRHTFDTLAVWPGTFSTWVLIMCIHIITLSGCGTDTQHILHLTSWLTLYPGLAFIQA